MWWYPSKIIPIHWHDFHCSYYLLKNCGISVFTEILSSCAPPPPMMHYLHPVFSWGFIVMCHHDALPASTSIMHPVFSRGFIIMCPHDAFITCIHIKMHLVFSWGFIIMCPHDALPASISIMHPVFSWGFIIMCPPMMHYLHPYQ